MAVENHEPSAATAATTAAATAAASEEGGGASPSSPASAETHHATLVKMDSLAAGHYKAGNYKDAADTLQAALALRETFLASDDVELLNTMNNLAAAFGRLKRYSEAETIFRRVLAGREKKLGPSHTDTLVTANHLGVIIKQQLRLAEAEPFVVRALDGLRELEVVSPDQHRLLYAEAAYNYGVMCVQLGRRRKAATFFRAAHRRLGVVLGPQNPHSRDAGVWEVKCMKDSEFMPAAVAAAAAAAAGEVATEVVPPVPEHDAPSSEDALALAPSTAPSPEDDEVYQSQKTWVNAPTCELCSRAFTTVTLVRPHHCRICARCVCDPCSQAKTVTKEFGLTTPVRCCNLCAQHGF
jgi:tetratricopeptide (TPR) repeat protein